MENCISELDRGCSGSRELSVVDSILTTRTTDSAIIETTVKAIFKKTCINWELHFGWATYETFERNYSVETVLRISLVKNKKFLQLKELDGLFPKFNASGVKIILIIDQVSISTICDI